MSSRSVNTCTWCEHSLCRRNDLGKQANYNAFNSGIKGASFETSIHERFLFKKVCARCVRQAECLHQFELEGNISTANSYLCRDADAVLHSRVKAIEYGMATQGIRTTKEKILDAAVSWHDHGSCVSWFRRHSLKNCERNSSRRKKTLVHVWQKWWRRYWQQSQPPSVTFICLGRERCSKEGRNLKLTMHSDVPWTCFAMRITFLRWWHQ